MSIMGKLAQIGINKRVGGQLEIRKHTLFTQGAVGSIGTGGVYYVDSTNGASTSTGKTPFMALATIDQAVGKCTANQGDVIYVLPGHTETISTATGLVIDIAGITIIGLGNGGDRPTLTLSASVSTISITAASVWVENLLLISSFTNGVAVGITVGDGADGLTLKDIEMQETTNAKEWLIGVSVATGCNEVTIDGFRYFGLTGGSTTQVIIFAGASNYSVVKNFLIYCDASGAAIDALTAASVWMTIGNGVLHNLDTGAGLTVSVKSDTTGFMHDLRLSGLLNGAFPAGAAMAISEVYISNVIFTQGFYGIVQDS